MPEMGIIKAPVELGQESGRQALGRNCETEFVCSPKYAA